MLVRVWITKTGQSISINQMTTSHIINCINLINRKNGWRRDFLEALELELYIRSLQK